MIGGATGTMATKENTPPPLAPPQRADNDEPASQRAVDVRPQRNRASVLEQVRRRKMERERARKEQEEDSVAINSPLPRKKEPRSSPNAPTATSEQFSQPQATQRAPEVHAEHEPTAESLPEPELQQNVCSAVLNIVATFGIGKLGMAFNAGEGGQVVLTKATDQAKTQGVMVGDHILKVGDCAVVPSMSLRDIKRMIVDATRPFQITFGRSMTEHEDEDVQGTPPPPQKQPTLDSSSPIAMSSHADAPDSGSHETTPDRGMDSSSVAGHETSPSPALSRRAVKRKNRALKAEALTRSKAEKLERAELDRADKERDLARRRAELLEAKANKEVEKAMAKTLAATKVSAELAQRTADCSDRTDSEVRTLHEAALRASRAAEAAASAKIDAERVHAAAVKAASIAEADARHSEAYAAAANKLRLAHAEAARTRCAALAALGETSPGAQSGAETDDDNAKHASDDGSVAHDRNPSHVRSNTGHNCEEKTEQNHSPTPVAAGTFAHRAVSLRHRTCACGAGVGSVTTVMQRSDTANSISPDSPNCPGQGLTFSVTFDTQNIALALMQRNDSAVVVQRVGPNARHVCAGDEIIAVNSSPVERCMTPYDVEQLLVTVSRPLIVTFRRPDVSTAAGISKSRPLVVSVLALRGIRAPAPRSKGMWNFYVRVKCGHNKAKTSAKRCVSGAEYCEWAEVLQIQTTADAVQSPPTSPLVRPDRHDGSTCDGGSDASSDNEGNDNTANHCTDSRVFIVELRNRDRYKGSITVASAVVSLDLVGRGTVACQLTENDQSVFGIIELTLRWGVVASAAQLEFMLDAERQHAARVGIRCGATLLENTMKRTCKQTMRRRFNAWYVATEHALDVHRKLQVVRKLYHTWGLWQLATSNSIHAARESELNECTRKLRVGFHLAIAHHQDRKACWQAWYRWRTMVEKLRRDEYDASVERLETTAREAQMRADSAQSADRDRTLVVLQSAALVVLEALAMGLRRRRMQAFLLRWKDFSSHIGSAHAAIFHASLMLQLGSLQHGSSVMLSTLNVSGAAQGARLTIASLASQKSSTCCKREWLTFHRSILQQLHMYFRLQRSVGRASAAGALQGATLRVRGKWQRAALLHWRGLCSILHRITENFSFVARAEQRFLTMKPTAAAFTDSDAQSVLKQELEHAVKRTQKRKVVARMARSTLNRCMNTWKAQVRYQKIVDGVRARGRSALYRWSRHGRGVCAAWRCWRATWERWKRNNEDARIWPHGKPPAILAQYRMHEEECITHSRHVHRAICIRQMQYVLCGARRAHMKSAMSIWKKFVAGAVAEVAATASAVLMVDGGMLCEAGPNTRRNRLLRGSLESFVRPPLARAWRTWVALVRQPKCGTFADRILHCLEGLQKTLSTVELMQQLSARTNALRCILACYRVHLLVARFINRRARRMWAVWAGCASETHKFGHSSPLRKVRGDTAQINEEQTSTTAKFACLTKSDFYVQKSTSCYIKVSMTVQVHALRQLALLQGQNSCLAVVVNVWRGSFGAPMLVGSFESYSSDASTVALDGAALVNGVEGDDTITVTILQRQNSSTRCSGFLLGQHTCSAAVLDGTSVDTRWIEAPVTRSEASQVVSADGTAVDILPIPDAASNNGDAAVSNSPLVRLKVAVWRGNEWGSYASRTLLEGCALSVSEPLQKAAAHETPLQQFNELQDGKDSAACYAWCSTTFHEVVWGKSPYARPDHVWLAKDTCIDVVPGVANGDCGSHCQNTPLRCALTLCTPTQVELPSPNFLHLWCLLSGTGERARDWINALQWLLGFSRGKKGTVEDKDDAVSESVAFWNQPGSAHSVAILQPQTPQTPVPRTEASEASSNDASLLKTSRSEVPCVGEPELGSLCSKPVTLSGIADAPCSAPLVDNVYSKRISVTSTQASSAIKRFPIHLKVVSVQGTSVNGMSISVCVRRHATQILRFELQLLNAGGAQSSLAWICEDNLTMLYDLDGSEHVCFELLHHNQPSCAVRSTTEEVHICVSDFNQGKKHRLTLALGESRSQNSRRESQPVAAVTAELWVGSASAELAAQILQCGITISLMECGATVPPHRQRERVCFVLLDGDDHLAWGVDQDNLNRRVPIGQMRHIEASGPSDFTVSGPAVTLRFKHAQSHEFASNFIEVCSWLQAFEWYIMRQNFSVRPKLTM